MRTLDQHEDFPEALADPEGLVWQVIAVLFILVFDFGGLVFYSGSMCSRIKMDYISVLSDAKNGVRKHELEWF